MYGISIKRWLHESVKSTTQLHGESAEREAAKLGRQKFGCFCLPSSERVAEGLMGPISKDKLTRRGWAGRIIYIYIYNVPWALQYSKEFHSPKYIKTLFNLYQLFGHQPFLKSFLAPPSLSLLLSFFFFKASIKLNYWPSALCTLHSALRASTDFISPILWLTTTESQNRGEASYHRLTFVPMET